MKKFHFVFRRSLAVNNYSFIGQLLHHIVIFALVFLPCFAYSAPFCGWGKNHESIIQDPYFFQTCLPYFEYIRRVAVPMNIIKKNDKPIDKGSLGGNIITEPIQADSNNNADSRTDKTRENYIYAHPFLVLLQLSVGALMGLFIGVFIFLLLVGHLEHFFSIGLLRKLKILKCFYYDPD